MKERMEAGEVLNNVKTCSSPSELRITDIRFADIWNAPMHCIMVKVFTNQGLVGYGSVPSFSARNNSFTVAISFSSLFAQICSNNSRIFQNLCCLTLTKNLSEV